jgi:transposase
MDAAHFVYGAFQGYLWSFERIFVKTGCGRQRFNVLGAYDPMCNRLITIENENTISAKTICKMLHKIRYQCGSDNISIVLDNARYQHCELVKNRASRLGIELVFLPPYSPNLNLIERYWKFVKKKCLNSKYHMNFSLFKDAIKICLHKTNFDKETRDELFSLMQLNFQIFKESQLLVA